MMEPSENEAKEARVAYDIEDDVALDVLEGVQYLVDSSGKRKAVVISLEDWGELWEDFYDVLVSESRKDEPSIPWEKLKAELANEESTDGGL
jgi:hypothetical protein